MCVPAWLHPPVCLYIMAFQTMPMSNVRPITYGDITPDRSLSMTLKLANTVMLHTVQNNTGGLISVCASLKQASRAECTVASVPQPRDNVPLVIELRIYRRCINL